MGKTGTRRGRLGEEGLGHRARCPLYLPWAPLSSTIPGSQQQRWGAAFLPVHPLCLVLGN